MELLNKILIDFIFFSSLDSFVVLCYYLVDRKLKFNLQQFIVGLISLSLINSIFSEIIPPLVFQVFFIMFAGLILTFIYKTELKRSSFSILKITLIVLVIQMSYAFLLNTFAKIDLLNMQMTLTFFMYLIPARIILFIFIYIKYKKSIETR